MAPASALAAVGAAVRSTAVGPRAGARPAVVSTGSTMGMGPAQTEHS